MIVVLEEFNNGVEDCLSIYDTEYKILESTYNRLWNTNEMNPIIVTKNRLNDYISSNIAREEIINHNIELDIEE